MDKLNKKNNDANIAAMQNAFGLQTAINGSTTAIGAQLTGLSTQLADCCCKTQSGLERNFADLNYNLWRKSQCAFGHCAVGSSYGRLV